MEAQKRRLHQSCREFESVMVSYMLKTMRDTVMTADKPDSARELYEDMLSQQVSKEVGNSERLGLGEMLYTSLEPMLQKNKSSKSDTNGQVQSEEMIRKLSDLSTQSQIGENISLKNGKPFAD
jgi:Rod binding domain-containing protein